MLRLMIVNRYTDRTDDNCKDSDRKWSFSDSHWRYSETRRVRNGPEPALLAHLVTHFHFWLTEPGIGYTV
jgi:hypothetical protein